MFDAKGHGLPSALLAATAVSADRSARRNGDGLLAQASAVDSAIKTLSPDGSVATGFLGELDLTSGRLRYLNAGHPDPFLLHEGRAIESLTGGRTMPFGLDVLHTLPTGGSATPTAGGDEWADRCGHETLEPGDWLVMSTDGVTEARDARGALFGDNDALPLCSSGRWPSPRPPLGPDHAATGTALARLGYTLGPVERHAEAEVHERRALAIAESTVGPDHPLVAVRLDALAGTLDKLQRDDEAGALRERAQRIRDNVSGADDSAP